MIRISNILTKINKCKEIELSCAHAAFSDKIQSVKDTINKMRGLILNNAQITAGVYKYRELLRTKIAQYLEEIKLLEKEKFLIEKGIEHNFLEGKQCKTLKEISLYKETKLQDDLFSKEENEQLKTRHVIINPKKR